MINYELLNLSSYEFENLTRDLLEKKFNIYIESFTSGSDLGIDLRFSYDKTKTNIVQCKRYKSFSSLYSSLKGEVSKIKKLNISNYYVSTTVGLTPQQKDKIYNLFNPLIAKYEDIFGKDDINKMLNEFRDIELKYYKLWLSSTNVLNSIIHSKVFNISALDLSDIENNIRRYVQNDSYNKSLKILKENNYIIISGVPGIGKTTLAKILIYNFLAKGFTEYVSLSDSINDAFKLFHESKYQIFFYDDFLGRNFLEDKMMKNEDSLLIKFITKIKESKNKLLIMTTREYILHQAQERHELLNNNKINIAKTILDISVYTKIIKAQILYNHLFFSSIPQTYINELLDNKKYLNIINHDNYNPRIIETIIENEDWNTLQSNNFYNIFISYFNNPESVWKHAFENQISTLSQIILLLILTTGTPILYNDLKLLINSFCENHFAKYKCSYSEIIFNKSLKEIEASFITFHKDKRNQTAIEFLNPSIFDFLFNYIKNNTESIKDILSTAIFINQYFYIFQYDKVAKYYYNNRKIELSNNIRDTIIENILKDHTILKSSTIIKLHYYNEKSFVWTKSRNDIISNISIISDHIELNSNHVLKNKLSNEYENYLKNEIPNDHLNTVIDLYSKFKDDLKCSSKQFLEIIFNNIGWIDDINYFIELKEVLPSEYNTFINKNNFKARLSEIINDDYYNVDDDYIEDLISNFELVQEEFKIDLEYKISDLNDKLTEIQNEEQRDTSEAYEKLITPDHKNDNVDSIIDNMFESLNYRTT